MQCRCPWPLQPLSGLATPRRKSGPVRSHYIHLHRGRPGPPALLVPNASGKRGRIELLYNGKDATDSSYRAGRAVFAADAPGRLLERSQAPFLSPTEPYERSGQVNAVTFVQGMAHVRGAWHLYYGTADSNIAVARVTKGRGRHALPRPGEGSWRLPSRRAATARDTLRRSSASLLRVLLVLAAFLCCFCYGFTKRGSA